MLMCTTWKSRPLTPEQTARMMEIWGKTEGMEAESLDVERLCWYIAADGSGGVTVQRVNDTDAAAALALKTALLLGEFLELESKVVLDLDAAMSPIIEATGVLTG